MSDPDRRVVVLYDGDCGFCKVALAALLWWDRARLLDPAPIESDRGARLLAHMSVVERLASWHLVDGTGAVRSGGAGAPVLFDRLPGGTPLARVAARFPRTTSHAYDWVASHRSKLGRLFPARTRARAARVVAGREANEGDHRAESRPDPPGATRHSAFRST
jgi:predicted DCC family thiol-disulfide oxidoreductase YuxK